MATARRKKYTFQTYIKVKKNNNLILEYTIQYNTDIDIIINRLNIDKDKIELFKNKLMLSRKTQQTISYMGYEIQLKPIYNLNNNTLITNNNLFKREEIILSEETDKNVTAEHIVELLKIKNSYPNNPILQEILSPLIYKYTSTNNFDNSDLESKKQLLQELLKD